MGQKIAISYLTPERISETVAELSNQIAVPGILSEFSLLSIL